MITSRRRRAPSGLLVALMAMLLAAPALASSTASGAASSPASDPASVGAGSAGGVPAGELAAPLNTGTLGPRLTHEVYGYLPYWKLDSGTDAYLRYDLLSTLAFFSIRYTPQGALDVTTAGYTAVMSSHATTIINHAHAAGVRVEVSVTFSTNPDTNKSFLANQTAMSRAIADTVALVTARDLDGVNIDLERLYNADFAAYGAFVGAMRAAVVAANPNGRVTVATNGNTSGAGMAKAAIANGADRAFLMGYSYRTSGANPVGSIAPLVSFNGTLDLTASLDKYEAAGVPANRIILGLPYYGRTWPTLSDALHAGRNTAKSSCSFSSTTPTAAQIPGMASGLTINHDTLERAAWFARYDSTNATWCQTYFDDARTLAAKYDLAKARGLAGAGIWALGYDRGLSSYWQALANSFAPPGMLFHPIGPSRLVDTRNGLGATTLRMAQPQKITVTGLAGVPADAVAITGNLTVTGATKSGFVSLTPARVTKPVTSTINFPAGDTRANAITMPLGTDGSVWAVYRAGSTSATVNVIFDITGYYAPDGETAAGESAGMLFHPIGPSRLVDTRNGLGATTLRMGQPQKITVTGLAGVPADAVAITGNLTVTGATKGGFVSLTPARVTKPVTSTINFPAGDTRANAITMPLGTDGSVWAVYRAGSTSATVNVIFDITGYYAPDGETAAGESAGMLFHPIGPSRLVDTRNGLGATTLRMGQPQKITVTGLAGVPADAVAITGNLTVTGATKGGFVSLTPGRVTKPVTSTINFPAGDTRANAITMPLGTDGSVWAVYRAGSTSATVNVIFDITGYYAPRE